jgi:Leucine-rich repeat (LRR) protein
MKLFLAFLLCLLISETFPTSTEGCVEVERDALFTFKRNINYRSRLFSSWHGPNCCKWEGVACDNITGHVVMLDLSNPYDWNSSPSEWASYALTGEINPSILVLRHLTYFDLSNHDFSNLTIPNFIGAFENLIYLNLSLSGFRGVIPYELGNLSKLEFLDLGYSQFSGLVQAQLGNLSNLQYLSLQNCYSCSASAVDYLSWVSHLSSLKYLDLGWIILNTYMDWTVLINKLQQLETLMLSDCHLSYIPNNLAHANLTSLKKLVLKGNTFNTKLPNWLWNLTNLLYLDLGYSSFNGRIPGDLRNLVSLNYLGLAGNNFDFVDLAPLKELCSLRGINLKFLKISSSVTHVIQRLSCNWEKLEIVKLASNQITGNVSSWVARMRNLSYLDLGGNSLSGKVTEVLGSLTQLRVLLLDHNLLSGTITEAHFAGVTNLKRLDLSNNFFTMKVNTKWTPPFQLTSLSLSSLNLGPQFPSWLRSQTELSEIKLSNTNISGVIPSWFLNPSLTSLDLSHNNLMGNLPIFSSYIAALELSNNNFSGPFPKELKMPHLVYLLLSGNSLSGSIPSYICDIPFLTLMDLSNNDMSGNLPDCWKHTSLLELFDVSNNQLTGRLPTSIGFLYNLTILQLDNNKLHGEIPSTIQHCRNLNFLGLGRNNFLGEIPEWIGESLQNLVVLQLRSNKFSSHFPPGLGNLAKLQVLDLSDNDLVGPIPHCIGNFSGMKNSSTEFNPFEFKNSYFHSSDYWSIWIYDYSLYIQMNGQKYLTSSPLSLVKTIDLSGNKLTGQIPEEIWSLQSLINLNLSQNYLQGTVSGNITDMRSLEYLDLSMNELSGPIPQALSILFSLHHLNLSYNNFSGRIPIGRQLDTLNDPSIYAGNAYLCGYPTNRNCSEEATVRPDFVSREENIMGLWLYLTMMLGLIVGFWGFGGILIFKRAWRIAYFQIIDNVFDIMYVQIMIAIRRLSCGV